MYMSEGLGTAAALGKMNGGKMKILVHHDVGKRLLEEVEKFCARGLWTWSVVPPGRCHLCPVLAVGCGYSIKKGQMHFWLGHQGHQSEDKIQWFED